MNEIEEAIPFHELMPGEAIDFFAAFSRAEYALKRHGYCAMRGGQLVVTWDSFADELPNLIEIANAEDSAQTLLNAPPKKQIAAANGSLTWEESGAVGSVRQLFLMIRRVRNNLFHGGKFHEDLDTDTSRDVALLREATWIIYRAIEMHPNNGIAATFRGGY